MLQVDLEKPDPAEGVRLQEKVASRGDGKIGATYNSRKRSKRLAERSSLFGYWKFMPQAGENVPHAGREEDPEK